MTFPQTQSVFRTVLLTVLALMAFAANSVLCRMALGEQRIDAASFTTVRLLSGALVLWLLVLWQHRKTPVSHSVGWRGSMALFVYAAGFSFAYITLETATGALILFGVVQISMIGMSIFSGARLKIAEWLGVALAFGGLLYLLLPGASAPSPEGFVLMAVAGVAWAVYTMVGKGSTDPLADSASHFRRALLMGLVMLLIVTGLGSDTSISTEGLWLAFLSGGFASGVGYAVWYTALRGLTATRAAVLQLLVPVIAALGGVLFVNEPLTIRFVLAAVLILGGILLVVTQRVKPA